LRETVSAYINSIRGNKYTSQYYSVLAVGTLTSFIIGRVAWKDYQLFLSYGPGGPPYNPFGWLVANILRPLRINMIDARKFETDPDQRSWLGENWLANGHHRPGSRPHTGPHPVPQRQLDQHPSKEIQQKFLSTFKSIGEQNPDLVKFDLSQYERHTDAMWVVDECPCYALGKDHFTREISHIHTNTDYSAHVVLSPRDAAKVIRSGWGQLHGLAGVSLFGRKVVPATYVLLYSPRNDDEIQVLTEIIRAGIGYMTDSTEIKAPA